MAATARSLQNENTEDKSLQQRSLSSPPFAKQIESNVRKKPSSPGDKLTSSSEAAASTTVGRGTSGNHDCRQQQHHQTKKGEEAQSHGRDGGDQRLQNDATRTRYQSQQEEDDDNDDSQQQQQQQDTAALLSDDGSSSLPPSVPAFRLPRCRKQLLYILSLNVKKAYNTYLKASKAAEKEGKPDNGPVLVDIPPTGEDTGDDWFPAEEIGAVSRNVGPGLRVDAYAKTREIEIHSLASGYRHANVCVYVNGQISTTIGAYSYGEPAYIQHSSHGTYGVDYITAPDVLLGSVGSPNGDGLGDSSEAPIFVCEIEHDNRSLPALIRHVGALFANYPHLNGVVGIKGGSAGNRNWAVLFQVEKTGTGTGLSITTLLDFGPDALTEAQKTNAQTTFALPIVQVDVRPKNDTHGLGVTGPFPWIRHENGLECHWSWSPV